MTEIPKAREVVEKLRRQVNGSKTNPLEGIAKHKLIDHLEEIVELKEERLKIIEGGAKGSRQRLMEINEEQNYHLEVLKSHGVPHHPVMGSKQDYELISPTPGVKETTSYEETEVSSDAEQVGIGKATS